MNDKNHAGLSSLIAARSADCTDKAALAKILLLIRRWLPTDPPQWPYDPPLGLVEDDPAMIEPLLKHSDDSQTKTTPDDCTTLRKEAKHFGCSGAVVVLRKITAQ